MRSSGYCSHTQPCVDSVLSRELQPTTTPHAVTTTPTPSTSINVLPGTPTTISGVQDLSLGSSGMSIKLDPGGGNLVAEVVQSGELSERLKLTVSLWFFCVASDWRLETYTMHVVPTPTFRQRMGFRSKFPFLC